MKKSRWSPADLERQRLVVRRIALRSKLDLRALAAARARLVAAVHKQIGIPLALAGCFVAGMIAVPRARPYREAGVEQREDAGRLRHISSLLRTIALAVPACRVLFRDNRGPAQKDSGKDSERSPDS